MRYPVAPRPQKTDDLTGSEGERKTSKLTEAQSVAIREERAAGAGITPLSRKYGISTSLASQICTGAAWPHSSGPRTHLRGHGTVEERLARGADRSGGPDACWPWKGKPDGDGYGRMHLDGKDVQAHRAALQVKLGRPLASNEVSRHAKGCPRVCVNPAHLQPGTVADNNHDTLAHDRQARGDRGGKSKLTEAQALEILALGPGVNFEAIGRTYGVTGNTVKNIVTGKRWKHLGQAAQS